MTKIAFIPARGGSKRLPRKNIKEFLGKPIIAYTIEAAKKAQIFNSIVVSTEDNEIAAIAKQYGAEVDQRPDALAADSAKITEVCLEYLKRQFSEKKNLQDIMVLYATAPLRNSQDIEAVSALLKNDCHYALAVSKIDVPIHQALRIKNTRVDPVFPQQVNQRYDEVETYYLDNGSTYAVNINAFLDNPTFYGPNLNVHIMPRERSIDIDTEEDFILAQHFGMRAKIL